MKATKSPSRKRGPKDRAYANKSQQHEVAYEPKRKKPAKKFGNRRRTTKSGQTASST